MFCSYCGAKIEAGERFCPHCGRILPAMQAEKAYVPPVQQPTPVYAPPSTPVDPAIYAIPLYVKTGLFKSEQEILLIGQNMSALIYLGKEGYKNLVEKSGQGRKFFQKMAGMLSAYRNYADSLVAFSIGTSVARHPGSVFIPNADIRLLDFYLPYDPERNEYRAYYSFTLKTASSKFKGDVERGVNIPSMRKTLKAIFGRRYH